MTLQYLEALKALGSGPATKFIIPLEFTQLIAPIGAMVQSGMQGDAGSSAGWRRAAADTGSGPAPA